MLQQSTERPIPSCQSDSGWPSQFRHPHGWRGWLVGHFMAFNNKQRSLWVLSLLELGRSDHVLEIGFGSGSDIQRVAVRVPEGFVGGIDHSKSMVQLATSKNRVAIGAGHVRLSQGSATDLPYESDSFDVVFATNVAQFWDQPVQVAREIRRVLKPGGRVALAVQPRNKGATDATAHEIGEKLLAALAETGFTLSRLERKPLGRVPVVCTLAVKS